MNVVLRTLPDRPSLLGDREGWVYQVPQDQPLVRILVNRTWHNVMVTDIRETLGSKTYQVAYVVP